jgi:hypothetical protein
MDANGKMLDKVNLGCGPNAPDGWLNVDGSWNAWFSNHPYLRKALVAIGLIKPNLGAQWNVRPLVHDLTKPCHFSQTAFRPFTVPMCLSICIKRMRRGFW